MSAERIDWGKIKRTLASAEQNLASALIFDERRKTTLLRKRAEYFAARRNTATESDKILSTMTFLLGKERYALDLAFLHRVVTTEKLVPVPGAPEHLLGVLNMSGEVGSVWDLAGLLEIPKQETGLAGHILMIKANFAVGLRVDYVEGSRDIYARELISQQNIEGTLPTKYLKGMTHDRLQILDVQALLAAEFLSPTTQRRGGQSA